MRVRRSRLSIYNLWRQVLEYFDAHLIGLTATPSKQTFGFFKQNLVMEYNHEKAVADGVNVNYDVYRIQTEITGQGAKIDAGFYIERWHSSVMMMSKVSIGKAGLYSIGGASLNSDSSPWTERSSASSSSSCPLSME